MTLERPIALATVMVRGRTIGASALMASPWALSTLTGDRRHLPATQTRAPARIDLEPLTRGRIADYLEALALTAARAEIAPGIVVDGGFDPAWERSIGGCCVAALTVESRRRDGGPARQPVYAVFRGDADCRSGQVIDEISRAYARKTYRLDDVLVEPSASDEAVARAEQRIAGLAHAAAYRGFRKPETRFSLETDACFADHWAEACASCLTLPEQAPRPDKLPRLEYKLPETIVHGVLRYWDDEVQGLQLSAQRNAMMPVDVRRPMGWYRADDHAALVLLAFEDEFRRQSSFAPGAYTAARLFVSGAAGLRSMAPAAIYAASDEFFSR